MNLAIAHNGDSMLKKLMPKDVELVERKKKDDLWCFQWTKSRNCILLFSDYAMCAWLKCGGSLEELTCRFENSNARLATILLGDEYHAMGVMFDRNEFMDKKVYRSNAGIVLDMCNTMDSPLKYIYVDRVGMPTVTSTVKYKNTPIGYRLGPNA